MVSISVGGQTISGWQEVRITRGIEMCPSSFDLGLTEKYPTQSNDIVILPGAPCTVMIGSDVVIAGYVDQYNASLGADQHSVHIVGRGMCQDLVDCSANFQTYQVNNQTLVSLATMLAQPFGVKIKSPDGDSPVIPQFNVILTETPYEIIERVARWANFLVYEDTDGSLVIARVGDKTAASGFVEGSNVQDEAVNLTMNDRYTEIDPVYLSTAFLNDPPPDAGDGNPVHSVHPGCRCSDSSFPARADGQARYRPLTVVSEQTTISSQLAASRAAWDMADAASVGRSKFGLRWIAGATVQARFGTSTR